ncbi:diguanylate cyclase (GGDEF) domain-containing protein [Paenibacillus sp. UNCCL117]|uniref:putative bifunctional diguanylate cyclase/phosphodiesterase n=1 Tax=unclassified Paenibacillus TaxID=185978 RepID=UPI0008910258|nr:MULTISPECIES: EAL domain-containing protein [unclassified Paenibacillus]SDD49995.1 diguanylate cyclase (GGDEF) domain-containing protein [Paenibacillus sp. cl123]SFW49819.1 diguanylate cyclase (GGDEF) domain-containing protein [Paenibacillus sp. UNCCL117]
MMTKLPISSKSVSRMLFVTGSMLLAFGSVLHDLQLFFGITILFSNIFLLPLVRLFGIKIGLPAAALVYGVAIVQFHSPAYIVIFLLEVIWIGLWQLRKPSFMLGLDLLFWVGIGTPITLAACYMTGTFSATEFILLLTVTAGNGLFNTLIADMLVDYLPLGRWLGMAHGKLRSIPFRRVMFHLSITTVSLPFLMNILTSGWSSYDVSTRTTLQAARNTADSIIKELDQWGAEDVLGVRLESVIQLGYLQEIVNRNTTQKLFDITITNTKKNVLASNSSKQRHAFNPKSKSAISAVSLEDNFTLEKPARTHAFLPTQEWRDANYVYTTALDRVGLTLTVSIPVKVYQDRIVLEHIYQLLYMIGSMAIAAILALAINRWLSQSLMQLAQSTTNLPARLKQMDQPELPSSSILEIASLIHNIKDMSQNLLFMFRETVWMNQQLQISEGKLHQLAYYDSLTGLPNRLLFGRTLHELLSRAAERSEQLAVMFADLNRFKQINDTMGHAAGDILLQKVAERFTVFMDDACQVFRLGGDEFVFIMRYEASHVPQELAERICACIEPPFELEGASVYTAVSIGISLFPEHGDSFEAIVKNADMAMYVAKERGTSSYHFYNQLLEEMAEEHMFIENGLRNALLTGQFFPAYQPKVSPATGRMTGYEALIRWNHPDKGLIPPAKFIPLAEASGMIVDIDMWVLREACRQTKEWQERGFPGLPVSVNLSAKHFGHGNLVDTIRRILEETGLEPRYVCLEITESVFIKQTDSVIESLTQLREMGIEISIDDFGTGYSSLNQLQRLPVTVVKLDRTFIQDLDQDEKKSAIVKAVIELAHSMGLKVVAEGIETEQERSLVTEMQCDELQGFYFCKPLPSERFERYMAAGHTIGDGNGGV